MQCCCLCPEFLDTVPKRTARMSTASTAHRRHRRLLPSRNGGTSLDVAFPPHHEGTQGAPPLYMVFGDGHGPSSPRHFKVTEEVNSNPADADTSSGTLTSRPPLSRSYPDTTILFASLVATSPLLHL